MGKKRSKPGSSSSAKSGKIKESGVHRDAYITEDYARAIQKERDVLIKAMLKEGGE